MDSSASIAVVGGSIAGCAAAIAAHRAGCRVTVFERSSGDLAERGFGVAIPLPLHAELVTNGYLDAEMPAVPIDERIWLTRSGPDAGQRELWRQPSRLLACNWGLLWKALRAKVSDGDYHSASRVVKVAEADDGVDVTADDGSTGRFDLVVGADGYRSMIRGRVEAEAEPEYAGYIGWRGAVAVRDLSDGDDILGLLDRAYAWIGFDGGHAVSYLIPDRQGGLRLNWMVYTVPPARYRTGLGMSYAAATETDGLADWFVEFTGRVLPQPWIRVTRQTPAEARAFQPIFDLPLGAVARQPFVLAGDAGTITRPHTGSGATKALQDALCLEAELRGEGGVAAVADAYGGRRHAIGNRLVELGRRMGRDQVLSTPPWPELDAASIADWQKATMDGQALYFLPGADEGD